MSGRLTVLTGPMFCGKTTELLRRIRRAEIAKRQIQVFKPRIDSRYGGDVTSHDQIKTSSQLFDHKYPEHILQSLRPGVDLVAVDEAQWCAPSIVDVCEEIMARGTEVLVAGLDLTFNGEPFGAMPVLLAKAEEILKLTAICTVCGNQASRTQRLGNTVDVIDVGGADKYAARCRAHHAVFSPAPSSRAVEDYEAIAILHD